MHPPSARSIWDADSDVADVESLEGSVEGSVEETPAAAPATPAGAASTAKPTSGRPAATPADAMDFNDYKSFWNDKAATPEGARIAVDGTMTPSSALHWRRDSPRATPIPPCNPLISKECWWCAQKRVKTRGCWRGGLGRRC